jgi:hypothetical protein
MFHLTTTPPSGASPIRGTRISGLLFRLGYALSHEHSRRWLAAIGALLTREGHALG